MKHLATFTAANDLAHSITERELKSARERLDDVTERNQLFSKALNEATTNYILTGFARIPEDGRYWNGWLKEGHRTYFRWDHYFRKLAKDLGRPFVFLPSASALVVSRRKYTEPLIAQFLLIQQEGAGRWSHPDEKTPVMYRKTNDRWYYRFHETMAPVIEAWLVECRTNPEFRKALKL